MKQQYKGFWLHFQSEYNTYMIGTEHSITVPGMFGLKGAKNYIDTVLLK